MAGESFYHNQAAVFQRYIGLTNQKPLLVANATNKILSSFQFQERRDFAFLDVGSGNGAVTIPITEWLGKVSNLSLTCIEPSDKQVAAFKEANTAAAAKANFIQQNVETISRLPRSDFILMSHLLFYIKDARGLMAKAADALNPSGLGLVVVNNPRSADALVNDRLRGKPEGGGGSSATERVQGALQDIGLQRMGMRFSVETVESTINASGCQDMNDDGKTIVSFFTQKSYEELSQGEVDSVRSIVADLGDEHRMLPKKEDYIWIYGPNWPEQTV